MEDGYNLFVASTDISNSDLLYMLVSSFMQDFGLSWAIERHVAYGNGIILVYRISEDKASVWILWEDEEDRDELLISMKNAFSLVPNFCIRVTSDGLYHNLD